MATPPSLNLADYLQSSRTNGPGNRDVFWVQGCTIGCPGCFNTHLWSFEARHIVPVSSLVEKLADRVGEIEGISFVGGEPMHQARALGALLEGIQALGLSTVVYSGFTMEYLLRKQDPHVESVLEHTDILIDGPYIEAAQDLSLIWRGSANQQINFLSDRYSKADIPTKEEYKNIEVHHFESEENDSLRVRRTGITF